MSAGSVQNDSVEALLPFYVNGTLEPEDRARVEAELDANPVLSAELEALTTLRETMQRLEFGNSPGRFGLARILREIEGQEQQKPSKPILPWSIAVAAVAALVAVGASWMTDRHSPSIDQAGRPTDLLTVAFQPNATQAEISDLLQDLDLEIAGGPSAIGLYKLTAGEQGNLSELAVQLRGRQDLIESVDMP